MTTQAAKATRLMHTMLRVKDLDKSLAFYTNLFGMRLLRKIDVPAGRFSLAFVGYETEADGTVIELTYNWDQEDPYEHGTAYGHLAFATADAKAFCDRLRGSGVKILREAGPMKGGTRVLAFVEDPDGYKVEILEE